MQAAHVYSGTTMYLVQLQTPSDMKAFMRSQALFILSGLAFTTLPQLQAQVNSNVNDNPFRQLYDQLPTPNSYRTASGAPGHAYWQQQVDYDMQITLDDNEQKITGKETITYENNSPDELRYLWIQLDQNVRSLSSDSHMLRSGFMANRIDSDGIADLTPDFDGGFKIESVRDAGGKALAYTINKTMMRVDLPKVLKPGGKVSFSIDWWYNINDRMAIGGRAGYEHFEDEDNYIYTIAQFFPRLCAYYDAEGWQNKQFLGSGEFTLEFGNYDMHLTVPSDHVVASTGVLQNPKTVLSSLQRSRLTEAKTADAPVLIVTEAEARKTEKSKAKGLKTWHFSAENVRDFAFASSRKFIWDAMGVQLDHSRPLAMSYYPKEGNPLWEQYSTEAVAQTLETYSEFSVEYPYPVAISVHTKWIGMEYPMICFNGGRPEEDGTYSARTKHGMISVIIHEVGHNFFPMIINSDERQWTWMDEGLNTFVQYLAEKEFDRHYPTSRGAPRKITDYMGGDPARISPIMTNSEHIFQFGPNAYGKPATALNILRETVMGRDLFDYAFKEYSRRWAFKRPTPADLFRTMEDASSVDLDWFWRGWFYTNDHVDLALTNIDWYEISSGDPEIEKAIERAREAAEPMDLSLERDRTFIAETRLEAKPELHDHYTTVDPHNVLEIERRDYRDYIADLDKDERALLASGQHFYRLHFENIGGLVMPLIVEFEYADGSTDVRRVPAEIWGDGSNEVSKVFVTPSEAVRITLDPFLETADTDLDNNAWPRKLQSTRVVLTNDFSKSYMRASGQNPMQIKRDSDALGED